MKRKRSLILSLIGIGIGTVLVIGGTLLWLVPQLRHQRSEIDNDRATISLIQQQLSNLTKLSQDIESIQAKQAVVETNIWSFLKEDTFFTLFEDVAKEHDVIIDTPAIADATPTGALIPRSVTINIRGSLDKVLKVIDDLQGTTPLIALQQSNMRGTDRAGEVRVTLTAATLWR